MILLGHRVVAVVERVVAFHKPCAWTGSCCQNVIFFYKKLNWKIYFILINFKEMHLWPNHVIQNQADDETQNLKTKTEMGQTRAV